MSTFNGNFETYYYFAQHSGDHSAILLNGWTYFGGPANEEILGGDYISKVRSDGVSVFTDVQTGTDTLSGGGGNDYIEGYGGNDNISGGDGSDTITGSSGDDLVNGNSGDDPVVFGGDGNDTVRGGQNNDTVAGENGNDFVSGDAGNDLLNGGIGADTFNFGAGFGTDLIVDFNRTQGDNVRIEAGSYSAAQIGADTVVIMSDGSTLTLANVSLSSLDFGWIHS